MFVPSDWFSVVREASRGSPFDVVAMEQEEFKNYKDFVRSRYTNRHFSSGGSVFRDVHFDEPVMNFNRSHYLILLQNYSSYFCRWKVGFLLMNFRACRKSVPVEAWKVKLKFPSKHLLLQY